MLDMKKYLSFRYFGLLCVAALFVLLLSPLIKEYPIFSVNYHQYLGAIFVASVILSISLRRYKALFFLPAVICALVSAYLFVKTPYCPGMLYCIVG